MCSFTDKHLLRLNSTKNQLIMFGPEKHRVLCAANLNIILVGQGLTPVDSVNNLGLVLDNNLRFHDNISHLIKKSISALKTIFMHKRVLDSPTKPMLCEALVLSNFAHCEDFYNFCITQRDKRRIQMVQNSCIRLIYSLRGRRDVTAQLIRTNTLNMPNRRALHCILSSLYFTFINLIASNLFQIIIYSK